MDQDEECPHGLGDPAWCSVCLKRTTLPEETFGDPFLASYRGKCHDCHEAIDVGDSICRRFEDGISFGVVHEECV